VARGGTAPAGSANLKDINPGCSRTNTSPRRAQIIGKDSNPDCGLSAWWGPRWKMKGSFNTTNSNAQQHSWEESNRGGTSPESMVFIALAHRAMGGQGLGGAKPPRKGVGQDHPAPFAGKLGPGGRPRGRESREAKPPLPPSPH
jgi:hypothetical protein